MKLDPDDPRPPYLQVANALKAAILTRKFSPGEKLPSQNELADHYGVSRMTVQQALRELRTAGLVVSRQGSGVFVRERTEKPVGLRPHIEAAFDREHVSIDFSGYTAETLHGALQEPLDKIRSGRFSPESVSIRLLISDMSAPIALPSRAGDNPGDDPGVRERMEETTRRYTGGIVESVNELADLGLVAKASALARVHGSAPLFKLYLLNNEELFFGFYPVVQHDVMVRGEKTPVFDPMGKDAVLFHHAVDVDEDDMESVYVAEARKWFDSVWNTIARDYTP